MTDDENGPPPRPTGPDGYDRLSTLEMESGPDASAGGESAMQHWLDVQRQMDTASNVIDWDRVFMAAFLALSLVLILAAFFLPSLKPNSATVQTFQHEFILDSLTVSEFKASPAQVTGKCDVILNISNLGDRSIYHEHSVLSTFMDHELLWVTRTGDFFLEVGDRIMFNVTVNTTSISVPASFVPTALVEGQKMHKPLRFKLKYDGMVREGMNAWHEERFHVYVVCGWIEMQFVSETTLKGGPASCSFENF